METRKQTSRTPRDGAFSLIEVNLAIFVVAIGLLSLFSLFPVGLKQGLQAHEETQTALFAAYALDGMRANALSVTAQEWDNIGLMEGGGSPLLDGLSLSGGRLAKNTLNNSIEFSKGADPKNFVRYLIEIDYDDEANDQADAGLDLYKVTMWIQGGEFGTTDQGNFKNIAQKFYTEFHYSGMP